MGKVDDMEDYKNLSTEEISYLIQESCEKLQKAFIEMGEKCRASAEVKQAA